MARLRAQMWIAQVRISLIHKKRNSRFRQCLMASSLYACIPASTFWFLYLLAPWYDFENGTRPLIYLAKILKEAKILEGVKVLPAVITPFFYNKFCGVFCLRRNFEGCSGWFEGRHKFLSPIRIYKLRVYPLPFLQLKVYNSRMYRCWTRMPPRFFWAGIYFPQLIANRISSKYFSRTNQFH